MDWPVALQPQSFRNFPLAHPALQHPLDFWQELLHFLIPSCHIESPPDVVLFSYIRGDFVYCPFLLVRFTALGGQILPKYLYL